MAGDFKCVLSNNDCTGYRSGSRSLERLINGLRLNNAWDASLHPHVFTQYTPTGAAHLDRIYVTEGMRRNKQGIETIAAAFTVHLAVLIRLNLSTPIIHRGRGRWRMNISLLNDRPFRSRIRDAWTERTKRIARYPIIVPWWVCCAKRRIKSMFIKEGAERNPDRIKMENFSTQQYMTCCKNRDSMRRKRPS